MTKEIIPTAETPMETYPDVEASLPLATYKFVFCDHTSANADRIAAELQDTDVVALEHVGINNQAERDELSRIYTKYVSSTANAVDKAAGDTSLNNDLARAEAWSDHDAKDIALLVKSLLQAFSDSDKQIELVDINADHPEFTLAHSYGAYWEGRERDTFSTSKSMKKSRAELARYLYQSAAGIEIREDHVVGQLSELGQKYPGARIGVMAGATHTPIQHEMAKWAETERVFVGNSGDSSRGIIYRWEDDMKIIRDLRLGIIDTVDEPTLNRLTLERYDYHYVSKLEYGRAIDWDGVPREQAIAEAEAYEAKDFQQTINSMSDEYVAELLTQIDGIIAEKGNPMFGGAVSDAINKLLHDAYDWVESIEEEQIPGTVNG